MQKKYSLSGLCMSTLLKTNLTPSKEKEKGEEMSHMMV
jgi:hypothetical protein